MRVTVITFFLAVLLASLYPLRAQEASQTPPASEITFQESFYQTPESYVGRVKREGAFLEMSLNDAIRLALTNNLEIEIENYNEDLARERIIGTKGFYDPTVNFQLTWNSFKQPNTRVLDAGADILATIRKSWVFNTYYQQNIVGGTLFRVFLNNDRGTSNDYYSTINPNYGSDFGFTITQPLWKGFRQTQTERQLKLYNLDTDISDSVFKQRVSSIIQRVENQYWELVFAIENYEARRRSLELAVVQYHNNQKRVEIGVMAPIEITSSRAEVATREQEMISSEVQIINAQNALKGLLSSDPRESIWQISLIPEDQPKVQDLPLTLDEAIDIALRKRPELEQIQLEVSKLDVDRKFYKREGKPTVDLTAGLTSIGTAGETYKFIPDPDTGQQIKISDPANPFLGDFRQAWDEAFRFRWLNWRVGVNVQIPLRNRTNEAQLAQIALNERQLRSQLKANQQEIMVDVRNAYEGITTRRKGYEAARVARQLVEEQLQGENKRFEAGLSTNFEVLRYQRDLAQAEVQELRAIVDYQLAVTALREATFSIIEDSDIVLARKDADTRNN